MKSPLLVFLLPVFLFLIFIGETSCESEKQPQVEIKKDTVKIIPKKIISYNRKYNDAARFIAGMTQTSGSSLSGLEKKESWSKYQQSIDSSWNKLESLRLKPIRDWAQTELSAVNASDSEVFYPFGGPDFLNVFTFFPDRKSVVWGK